MFPAKSSTNSLEKYKYVNQSIWTWDKSIGRKMKKYGKYEQDLPVIQFVGFVGPTGEIQRGVHTSALFFGDIEPGITEDFVKFSQRQIPVVAPSVTFVQVFKGPQQRDEPMYTPRDQPTTDSGFQLIGQFEWAATVVLLAVVAVVAAATLAPIRLAVATADDLTHAALVST
jgi:hypothetical protein